MEFISEYGLFLLKAVTIVAAMLAIIGAIAAAGSRGIKHGQGHIEVRDLNEAFKDMAFALKSVVLDDAELKQQLKQQKKADKKKHSERKKALKHHGGDKHGETSTAPDKRRIYVIDFNGDIRASAVRHLREEVSAVLTMAAAHDEVVVKLESAGGMVHSYGLAASQLDRLRAKGIPLTICVDKVAASGGYMMACIGNKIVAAPFAMIGSIGVVAQLPNFHRLLQKNDVDFELFTAGEYKRTLTLFGENTEKGREKFMEELEETHELFKSFVAEHRPEVDIDVISTGEVWYGKKAAEEKLIDELGTSDQYLMDQRDDAELFEVKYVARKNLQEKMGLAAEGAMTAAVDRALQAMLQMRFFS